MDRVSNTGIKALSFFNVLKRKFLPKEIANLQGAGSLPSLGSEKDNSNDSSGAKKTSNKTQR